MHLAEVAVVHDLLIRGGLVVDGSGGPSYHANVVIDGDTIVQVGPEEPPARRVVDAEGALVTPGFVDIHTHYDGQAIWDDELIPSSLHGVSTVVCGNCGVGFAPVRPARREWIMGLMEGVEDIPGTALAEGLDWSWESFPEFLEALDRRPHMIDIGVLVGHGPVRAYAMGERGEKNERPSADDIADMGRVVEQALEAGALGFSTSRTTLHRSVDGEPVPGTWADRVELMGITNALRRRRTGTLELVTAGAAGEDLEAPASEMALVRELARYTHRPISFGTAQAHIAPDQWREVYAQVDQAARGGDDLYPQVLGRAQTVLIGHEALHPFRFRPTYLELSHLPLRERVERLREPSVKARILQEESLPPPPGDPMAALFRYPPRRLFPLGDPPDYEPDPSTSVAARAEREGRDPLELLYDILLQRGGHEFVMYVLMNYSEGDLRAVREMLTNERSIAGLSDGGAHYTHVSDASAPTYMLTHWARDRRRGPRLPLERVVQKQTSLPARAFGLADRGVLRAGKRADVNVIDFDALTLHCPEMVHDLPAGAGRLIQGASGYVANVVGGAVIRESGQETGARPGRLVRRQRAGG